MHFTPGQQSWFNNKDFFKSNAVYQLTEKRNPYHLPIECRKIFDKIQYLLIIKTQHTGKEGNLLN